MIWKSILGPMEYVRINPMLFEMNLNITSVQSESAKMHSPPLAFPPTFKH